MYIDMNVLITALFQTASFFLVRGSVPGLSKVFMESRPVRFIKIGYECFDIPENACCRFRHLTLSSVPGGGPLPLPWQFSDSWLCASRRLERRLALLDGFKESPESTPVLLLFLSLKLICARDFFPPYGRSRGLLHEIELWRKYLLCLQMKEKWQNSERNGTDLVTQR